MQNKIPLDEMKEIEVNILDEFVKFCSNNNLRYYLAYGTLLGAVRHKDFIPWDDDVDIIMPRPDYNQFLKLTKDKFHDYLKVCSPNYTNNYFYPFAKIIDTRTTLRETSVKTEYGELGVYIDIFPIDGMPDRLSDIKMHYFLSRKLKFLLQLNVLSKNKWTYKIETIIKRAVIKICSLIGYKKILNYIEKLALKYDFNNSQNIGVIVTGSKMLEVVKKEEFLKPVLLEFRGRQYSAPSNYDQFLTILYGDYMKLPPKEEQVTHHKYIAEWKKGYKISNR